MRGAIEDGRFHAIVVKERPVVFRSFLGRDRLIYAALATLKTIRRQVANEMQGIEEARGALDRLRTGSGHVCTAPQEFLQPTQTIIAGRQAVLTHVQDLVKQILTVDDILARLGSPSPSPAPAALSLNAAATASPVDNARRHLTVLVKAVTELMGGLSTITHAGRAGDWDQVKTRLTQLRNHATAAAIGQLSHSTGATGVRRRAQH